MIFLYLILLQVLRTHVLPTSAAVIPGPFPGSKASSPSSNLQQPIAQDPNLANSGPTYKGSFRNATITVDDGFYFGNPSTDCKYASQPYIYSQYKTWSEDKSYIASLLVPDVDFTIVGHHPLSGHYHDFKHFYANAFWRIGTCITETYPELFKITLLHIHGGCDEEWSVQEIKFEGKANNGVDFELINVWVTRWRDGRIIQARTYIDAQETNVILYQNEDWTNSTTYTDHRKFLPGPRGMPDMGWMARYGHY